MSKSPEQEHPHKGLAWAARDDSSNLSPYKFSTRDISADDIAIKIHYCGVCHSDYHTVKNDWKNTVYPIVPGHEIVGFAMKVGSNVKKFKAGDRVGVGVLIGSCKECNNCKQDLENYCSK